MSLKLNERYPGRFNNPSDDYPNGSFKNRTTPESKDGSYLEKDWANDKEGFFQSLLSGAGVAANGLVDKVGSSQFYTALISIIKDNVSITQATELVLGGAKIATQAIINAGTNDTSFITAKKLFAWVQSGVSQATETLSGFARIATQTEVNNTASDFLIVTPKKLGVGMAFLKATNGYFAFPTWLGGWVLQWGTTAVMADATTITVTLPMAFPNANLWMDTGVVTLAGSSASTESTASPLTLGTISVSFNSTGGQSSAVRWFALGY